MCVQQTEDDQQQRKLHVVRLHDGMAGLHGRPEVHLLVDDEQVREEEHRRDHKSGNDTQQEPDGGKDRDQNSRDQGGNKVIEPFEEVVQVHALAVHPLDADDEEAGESGTLENDRHHAAEQHGEQGNEREVQPVGLDQFPSLADPLADLNLNIGWRHKIATRAASNRGKREPAATTARSAGRRCRLPSTTTARGRSPTGGHRAANRAKLRIVRNLGTTTVTEHGTPCVFWIRGTVYTSFNRLKREKMYIRVKNGRAMYYAGARAARNL
jgi:hypothetical protein